MNSGNSTFVGGFLFAERKVKTALISSSPPSISAKQFKDEMNIEPIYKRKEVGDVNIPPVEGYKPGKPVGMGGMSLGEMVDILHKDSGNLGGWMRDYGGYHYDKDLKKFVHD